MRLFIYLLLGVVFLHSRPFSAQADSLSHDHSRRRKLIVTSAVGGISLGSLAGLNQLWYKEYNTGRFHFFDDSGEWLQMDKAGHVYTAYQTSRLLTESFSWAGFGESRSLWLGGGTSLLYLTAIELMDGYSRGWGFSWSDQISNIGGTSLAMIQEAAWGEQKIQLKFSYAESGLAAYNPSLLGRSFTSRLLKDYNGQTYWLSVSPLLFISGNAGFPAWLNLSFGYAAYGMLGGHHNRMLAQDEDGLVYLLERSRRFYLSVDVDLTKIRTRSKLLKTIFTTLNILKFPAPALEMSKTGLRFYPVYF